MKITILTLFPDMFSGPFEHSIVKRAQEKGLIELEFLNIRDFGLGKHQIIDDTPYGGGIGMVMRVDVIHQAIETAKKNYSSSEAKRSREASFSTGSNNIKRKVILMTASGAKFNQTKAREFAELEHLIILCGHYEGIDERITKYIDEEVSIGDFVLTGGEIPAMLITDAVSRLLKGVITDGATEDESFSIAETNEATTMLEYPHYTKPQEYEGMTVPDVLLSGDHKKIADWRNEKALEKTTKVRPDLLKK